MWFIGVEVEQETSASPPKKNPGSAPVNVYAPTDVTQSESTKNALYTALNKGNEELDHIPSCKSV